MSDPEPGSAWIEAALRGRGGDALSAAWGFAEASVFFLVPDILLTLSGARSVRRSLRHLAAVVTGSIAAGVCLFAWSARQPGCARSTVEAVPFVHASMFERVNRDFGRVGVWALCLGPASGIPYKVYCVLAPEHTTGAAFALVSVPARAERLVLTWAQFVAIGWALRRWTRRPLAWTIGVHMAYWVVAYAVYWWRVGGP